MIPDHTITQNNLWDSRSILRALKWIYRNYIALTKTPHKDLPLCGVCYYMIRKFTNQWRINGEQIIYSQYSIFISIEYYWNPFFYTGAFSHN